MVGKRNNPLVSAIALRICTVCSLIRCCTQHSGATKLPAEPDKQERPLEHANAVPQLQESTLRRYQQHVTKHSVQKHGHDKLVVLATQLHTAAAANNWQLH